MANKNQIVGGETIRIVGSDELDNLKLSGLAGRLGVVVEVHEKGVWARLLGTSFMEEKEWFVPMTAIKIEMK